MQEHSPTFGRSPAAQVEEALVGSHPGSGWKIRGRGVDDQLRPFDGCLHLVDANRPAPLDVQVVAEASRLIEVAPDYPHLRGNWLKASRYRARGSTGSDDRNATVLPTPTLPHKGGGRR